MADTTSKGPTPGTNDLTATDAKKKKKAPKKKGPIRWEAIIPFVIFVALVWTYFFFFFDNHLRRGLEYVGTQANGAEVNIDKIRTSFWSASLEIVKIQVTDLDQPSKNKIQIGEVRWKMLWDALLRGKVAIEDASILEVAVGVPRAKPGRVLPPPPPGSESAFDKVRQAAIKKAEEEFSNNILGDVAALLSGVDPADQLKTIEGQLKSSIRVKELQVELKKKEQEWQERLASLPQKKDLDALQTRLKSVKKDGFQNPQELQASLTELDSIFKEADAKYKAVQSTGSALSTDVGAYQNTLRDLEAMVRQDIKDLENRLKLPKLDVSSITRSIFGPLFLDKVKQAEFYMAKARAYLPPKKTPEEKAEVEPPKPKEREDGRNFKFGRPNSYPMFWLKHAAISSKATKGSDWSGDLSGTLRDVTDDPPILGRPTVATFKGDFPKQELFGVLGEVTIDHTTSNPVERANLKVASFPIVGQRLVDSEDVKLGFDAANGSSDLVVELRGKDVKITAQNVFSKPRGNRASQAAASEIASPPPQSANQPKAGVGGPAPGDAAAMAAAGNAPPLKGAGSFLFADAKQPILAEILRGAVADIPKVTLNASVAGPWSNLSFNLNSNLGDELAGAFDKQIKLKINEAKAKLQTLVDEQVGKEKAKLEGEFNKLKLQVDSIIKDKQAEIDKAKNQIEQAKNEAINSQKKKLEGEGQKAIDDLKKKFNF